jgi:hypothetical protein
MAWVWRNARWRRLALGILVAAGAAVLLAALPTRASGPVLSLSVVPGDLSLRPGTSAQEALVVRNDDNAAIKGVKLGALQPDGVHVDGLSHVPASVAAHTSVSVPLTVSLDAFSLGGTAAVTATYQTCSGTTEISSARIAVHPAGAESVNDLVSTEVRSTEGAVDQNTDGAMVLLIHNKGDVELHVLDIGVATTSVALKVVAAGDASPPTVKPLDTAVLRYTTKVEGRTKAGKQMVTFTVTASMPPQLPAGVRVVAVQSVDVQVFGESALLGAAAVPSLLVLPGFLLVATLGFLAKQASPRIVAHVPDPSGPYFWLLAVTSSLVAMPVYRLITGRWYFDTYDFTDIVVLWFASIAIGILVFLVWWVADGLYQRNREPRTGDDPVTLLRKLARTGGTPRLPHGPVQRMPGPVAVLPFPVERDATKRWVAPRIRVTVAAADEPALTCAVDANDPTAQANLITQHAAGRAQWELHGLWPQIVDQAETAQAVNEEPLVDIEVQ